MMSQPALSLVLFDIDGTIMRGAGSLHKEALAEGIRRVTGITATLDGIPTAGMLDRDLIKLMLRASGQSKRLSVASMRQVVSACEEYYVDECRSDLTPYLCRGVSRTVAELKRRGAALGLVTGNLTAIGWKKIELTGLKPYFSLGAFAEDGTTRARLARLAASRARRLGLIDRHSRISLIGDHANDIAAAKANGFQSVGVATGVMSIDELARFEPDLLVPHLEELELGRLLEYPIERKRVNLHA